MNRAERWVVRFWWLMTVMAAIALFAPMLLFLLFVGIVTIPLALLGYVAPTVWAYLTPAMLAYMLLRRAPRSRAAPRWALAMLACLPPLAAGLAVPALANQRLEARLEEMMASDRGSVPRVEPVHTLAYLSSRPSGWDDEDRKCYDFCQRLLFTGLARAVIVGWAPGVGEGGLPRLVNGARLAKGQAPPPLTLHEIVPIAAGCDNRLLAAVRSEERDVDAPDSRPFLWEKLKDLERQGRCFRSRAVSSAEADLEVVSIYEDPDWIPHEDHDLRLVAIGSIERREVWKGRGAARTLLLRRTRIGYGRIAAPLSLAIQDFMSGRPVHWNQASTGKTGEDAGYGYDRFLANDLAVRGLERTK
jgi:hypothetical protein